MRPSNRKLDQIRNVEIIPNINIHAEGSCLIKFGNTHVICTASVEEKVPPFMRNKGLGWVTAEYNMLARSTHSRMRKDPMKPNGRAMEIQRLIGRSLRACINDKLLGERQIIIDCDVIQADGGTRCASITGGYVALAMAVEKLLKERKIYQNPITSQICAVSCGVYKDKVVADLDYIEDSGCSVDTNFVINDNFDLIEIQGTAEDKSMSFDQVTQMYTLAKKAAEELFEIQNSVVKS